MAPTTLRVSPGHSPRGEVARHNVRTATLRVSNPTSDPLDALDSNDRSSSMWEKRNSDSRSRHEKTLSLARQVCAQTTVHVAIARTLQSGERGGDPRASDRLRQPTILHRILRTPEHSISAPV